MSKADTIFFTTVLFSLRQIWDNTSPTGATDGKSLWLNSNFFMSLDEEERIFLLVHEAMHVACQHMLRRGDRDHKLWNIACDHYINLLLISRGFKMPACGLADPQYKDLNPDQIYPLLPKETANCSDGFGFDLQDPNPDTPIEEATKAIEDILIRASMASKVGGDKPGTIPGTIEIFLEKLLNPKLPWQRILARWIQNIAKNDFTFKKPNRRYFPEYHLPSAFSNKLIDLAIAVDASGSVSDAEFLRFVSETHGIMRMMKPDNITLIQFDSGIRSVNKVRSILELSKIKFTGRGGTKIQPVLEWANENKPQLLLVFSDGDFRMIGNTKIPVIWLIHNREQFTAPFGKVIHYQI